MIDHALSLQRYPPTGKQKFFFPCVFPSPSVIAQSVVPNVHLDTNATKGYRMHTCVLAAECVVPSYVMTSSLERLRSGPTGMIMRPPRASCSFSG
jgi:hypothetical protein